MEFLPIDQVFDSSIHFKSPPIHDNHIPLIHELRSLLKQNEGYDENWCTDHILHLFLIARSYKVNDTYKMMIVAKTWRDFRKPHDVVDWDISMQKESETGKIYCPGRYCTVLNCIVLYFAFIIINNISL